VRKFYGPYADTSADQPPVVSTHSRAARRAASPSIDTDKSLKEVDPPEETTQPDDVLAARKGSGVSKKKHQKPLTRQQRLRKEKGIARAEAVVDQLENKVVKSKSSARVIKSRAVCIRVEESRRGK